MPARESVCAWLPPWWQWFGFDQQLREPGQTNVAAQRLNCWPTIFTCLPDSLDEFLGTCTRGNSEPTIKAFLKNDQIIFVQ